MSCPPLVPFHILTRYSIPSMTVAKVVEARAKRVARMASPISLSHRQDRFYHLLLAGQGADVFPKHRQNLIFAGRPAAFPLVGSYNLPGFPGP
ncbi:MAG: hypothetical protein JW882_05320 [Deltaproteobacteria bacterium]|nr:hypothetical protein [Deltaproteobacteria bacterium]